MLCIKGYICRSRPPIYQYDGGGVHPPPLESGGKAQPPEMAAGPELLGDSLSMDPFGLGQCSFCI